MHGTNTAEAGNPRSLEGVKSVGLISPASLSPIVSLVWGGLVLQIYPLREFRAKQQISSYPQRARQAQTRWPPVDGEPG